MTIQEIEKAIIELHKIRIALNHAHNETGRNFSEFRKARNSIDEAINALNFQLDIEKRARGKRHE